MPQRFHDTLKKQLAIMGVVGAIVAGTTLAIAGPTVGLLVVADSSVVTDSSVVATPSPTGNGLPGTSTAHVADALEGGLGLLVLVGFATPLSIYARKRIRKTERR